MPPPMMTCCACFGTGVFIIIQEKGLLPLMDTDLEKIVVSMCPVRPVRVEA